MQPLHASLQNHQSITNQYLLLDCEQCTEGMQNETVCSCKETKYNTKKHQQVQGLV